MPHAGQLKEVLAFREPVRAAGPSGQPRVTYRDVKTVRGRVVEARGKTAEAHAQQAPTHTHRVEFRSRTVAARHDWVIGWRGQTLQIVALAPLADANTDHDVAYCVLAAASSPGA